jgi:hypothetical protein
MRRHRLPSAVALRARTRAARRSHHYVHHSELSAGQATDARTCCARSGIRTPKSAGPVRWLRRYRPVKPDQRQALEAAADDVDPAVQEAAKQALRALVQYATAEQADAADEARARVGASRPIRGVGRTLDACSLIGSSRA